MKTPCLKCGLIHDDPTAICDGYAGLDPDETSGDTRKKAAERIRAILAAVPIESRRPGRARAAAAGASASHSEDTSPQGAARMETPPEEVPEWRREVTERLESYRSKRERQSRQGGTNQSVLEFRVHSKSELVQEAQAAAPAALEGPTAESDTASPLQEESAAERVTVNAAAPAATSATAVPQNGREALRSYQPIEESEMNADLTTDLAGLATEVHENGGTGPAAPGESIVHAAETADSPASLPIASEPAVVLADSATLEVHADPAELADVQTAEAAAALPLTDLAPLASIPAIDTDYWRAVPSEDAEPTECGSLTSGFEPHTGTREEATQPEIAESLHSDETEDETEQEELIAREEPVPEEEPELSPVAEAHSLEGAAEAPAASPVEDESPAVYPSEPCGAEEPVSSEALITDEQEETENRRAALRTAARPSPGGAPERIEIRVPQPVFDFSPPTMENQQPQDEALPVADLRERRCAALIDAALLGFTVTGFFLAFHLAGGEFAASRAGIAVSLVTAFLIYAQYVLLFTFVGGSTPGMALRGLRVVSFDGRPPGAAELAWRSFGYLLSAAAGMLGFLWSAWDEHGLSWHDRISQTYITYSEPEVVPAVVSTQ
jgi:uncharacterized RDD family membrane protein YckC